jgi:phosphonate transport system substrate-binding protein
MTSRREWCVQLGFLLGSGLALAACERAPAPVRVSFARRAGIASVRQEPDADAVRSQGPLRVAVAAILSPKRNLEAYHDLLTFMGRRLGRGVQIFQRGTYAEINDLIRHREADLAFACGGAFVAGEREFGMQVLVVPQVRGKTEYQSYLIVNRRSPYWRLDDLRGASFAFSDPLSNSGRLAIAHTLLQRGEAPERFFRRTIFTYSHDNSILAVADGLVDGAAVDSLVYDYLTTRDPEAVRRTRVVGRWGPYGIPPVVVHPDLEPALRSALRGLLLSMHAEPEGQRILERLLIDRFVDADPGLFQSIRRMEARVRGR